MLKFLECVPHIPEQGFPGAWVKNSDSQDCPWRPWCWVSVVSLGICGHAPYEQLIPRKVGKQRSTESGISLLLWWRRIFTDSSCLPLRPPFQPHILSHKQRYRRVVALHIPCCFTLLDLRFGCSVCFPFLPTTSTWQHHGKPPKPCKISPILWSLPNISQTEFITPSSETHLHVTCTIRSIGIDLFTFLSY